MNFSRNIDHFRSQYFIIFLCHQRVIDLVSCLSIIISVPVLYAPTCLQDCCASIKVCTSHFHSFIVILTLLFYVNSRHPVEYSLLVGGKNLSFDCLELGQDSSVRERNHASISSELDGNESRFTGTNKTI